MLYSYTVLCGNIPQQAAAAEQQQRREEDKELFPLLYFSSDTIATILNRI